jgi:hypothetical protein
MRLFECQGCGHPLYFENSLCESCGRPLGFLSAAMTMTALEPSGGRWKALADPLSDYIYCANLAFDGCNWLIPANRSFAPRADTTAQSQIYPTRIILPCGGALRSQNEDFFTAYCG